MTNPLVQALMIQVPKKGPVRADQVPPAPQRDHKLGDLGRVDDRYTWKGPPADIYSDNPEILSAYTRGAPPLGDLGRLDYMPPALVQDRGMGSMLSEGGWTPLGRQMLDSAHAAGPMAGARVVGRGVLSEVLDSFRRRR